MNKEPKLKYFPVSFFSVVMGLAGFVLVTQKAESILNKGHALSTGLLYGVMLIFALITILYATKIIKYPSAVAEEKNNPVRLSFFPTFTISLLLVSTALLEVNPIVSKYIWIAGASLHFIATILILSAWIWQSNFEINHFNPAWFIPIVGNIIVPIAGSVHFPIEISWFFFSIGIIFWILLFTIFLYRIIFHNPIVQKLLPTFFILIAPPSLAFISYVKLNGAVDNFANVLYYFALFLVIFLLAQVRVFYRIKFYLSWWAYSFPIASVTVATSLMYAQSGTEIFKPIFFGLAALLTFFIAMLILFTMKEIAKGEICVKEE